MPDISRLSIPAQDVYRYDPDRFVTALFAPENRREDLFALYAFNAEVARIREMVREPLLGQMRLQWWRESLERIYSGRTQSEAHPVANALGKAIRKHDLPRPLFDTLLDARERDMDDIAAPTRAEFDVYVTATGGGLARLAVNILGSAGDEELGQAAAHIGTAQAIIGLLRSAPFHAANHRLHMPGDQLATHGIDLHDMMHGDLGGQKLSPIVASLCADAEEKLQKARLLVPRPDRSHMAAFLAAIQTKGHLRRLKNIHFDILDHRLSLPARRPVAMLIAMLLRRY